MIECRWEGSLLIDETPISWRTFKQKSVSLSTMEADANNAKKEKIVIGVFKCKQCQEREDSKRKLPQIDKFLSQHSTSTSISSISFNGDLDDVANTVLLETPTERNSTVIAVQPTADRVKDDHVCMEHVKAEEPSISTFF
ncbi:hypothetical protein TNCV_2835841 [Trichonephila clavipes]|nr:hypothetical protein TNCV_2835841 [Trichonephila clavipes]